MAGLAATGVGCGADPEMIGAAGAWADVAEGVAAGTATGVGDSMFMMISILGLSLIDAEAYGSASRVRYALGGACSPQLLSKFAHSLHAVYLYSTS